MANFVSYANATELMQAISNKIDEKPSGYIQRGSVTFANLPTTLTASMVNYAYNVSDDFTTTMLFVEGSGKKYSAGTNVVVVKAGTESEPVYLYDVYGNFVNVDGIYTEIGKVSDMITDDVFDDTATYAIDDIVKYENGLYKFKAAHAPGAWNATEVDQITILDLVKSAEPDSLTTEQVNALLALLA